MTTRSPKRRGIIKFLGNIVDDSKDAVDDILDRARDVERDLRSAARKVVDDDTDGRDDEVAATDIRALQIALAELTEKVNQLAALQGRETRQRPEREKKTAASAS
jgi:hypothetical protein